MDKIIKTIIAVALIVIAIFCGISIYNYVVRDITSKVRKGVAQGIGDGVVNIVNPLNLSRKLFAGKNQ